MADSDEMSKCHLIPRTATTLLGLVMVLEGRSQAWALCVLMEEVSRGTPSFKRLHRWGQSNSTADRAFALHATYLGFNVRCPIWSSEPTRSNF